MLLYWCSVGTLSECTDRCAVVVPVQWGNAECTNWRAVVLVQCGKVQQAIDTSVHLNQWNTAIDLARNHNVRDTEPLLIKYAETLLEQNKTFSAVELYRKANHLVDAAKLLFQVQMLLYYWPVSYTHLTLPTKRIV